MPEPNHQTPLSDTSTPAYWTLYEDLLGWSVDSDQRETNVNDALENYALGIVDDPSYQADATVNDVIQALAVTRKSALACDIIAMPGDGFCIGDIVGCFGEHWIIIDAYNDKIGLIRGKMWLCNMSINFQNFSETIYTRYCVVDDGTYSKHSSDPDAFVMTNTYKMYLPIDEQTIQLYVDKRLAFGSIYNSYNEQVLEVYKTIGIDIKSANIGDCSHMMVLTLQRDVYDPAADSIILNLCDQYIAPDDETEGSAGTCKISGSNIMRIGSSKVYTATFEDERGAPVVSGITPVWAVSAPTGITHSASGNKCIISVPFEQKYIGSTVSVSVADSGNQYGSYTLDVEVVTVG